VWIKRRGYVQQEIEIKIFKINFIESKNAVLMQNNMKKNSKSMLDSNPQFSSLGAIFF
jgi:hypothetical protein